MCEYKLKAPFKREYLFQCLNYYRTIANLLQCDVMMHLMNTILDRALDLKTKSFQENHLQKVKLILILQILQLQQKSFYNF